MYCESFSAVDLCGARGDQWLFEGVTFALTPGDALLVRGPNGAGKSTLLRILAGLLPPADGETRYGFDSDRPPPLHFVGHANAIKQGLSVEKNAWFWARNAGLSRAAAAERLDTALAAFGLAGLRDVPARFLSAGQKRRLALARLLASPAALWVLDEPTTALDASSVALVEQALATHRAAGGMAVVATHQPLALPGAALLTLGPDNGDAGE